MSYLCGIRFYNVDSLSKKIKKDLVESIKNSYIRTNYLTSISDIEDADDPEDYIGFEDNPTEVIENWIERNSLTISYDFINEDEESETFNFINGN